ncbi:MAG: hypothetical protein WC091_13660 [Sulfuricellaceae bacterium]
MRNPIIRAMVRALLAASAGWCALSAAATPDVFFQPIHLPYDYSGFLALTADGSARSGIWHPKYDVFANFSGVEDCYRSLSDQVNVPREIAWPVKGRYTAVAATSIVTESLLRIMTSHPFRGTPAGTALDADGRVWVWYLVGYNYATQLLPSAAVPIPGVANVKAVAGSLLLKQDGTVWRWFERETTGSSDICMQRFVLTAEPVAGLDRIVAIASKGGAEFALKADGTLWSWGNNYYGQLGLGDREDRATPTRIPGIDGVVAVFPLGLTNYAAKADGSLWGWGYDIKYLTSGVSGEASPVPQLIPGIDQVKQMAAGPGIVVALKHDGTVWAWGTSWGTIFCGQICAEGDDPCPQPPLAFTPPVRLRGIGNDVIRVAVGGTVGTALLGDTTIQKRTIAIVHADGSITVIGAPLPGVHIDYGASDRKVYALGRVTDLNLLKPPSLPDTDRILDWSEQTYPDTFSPTGSVTQTADGYTYRYYRDSKSYLGAKDDRLWYLKPGAALDHVQDVGSLAERLEEAKRAGY